MNKYLKENLNNTDYQTLLANSSLRSNLISWYPFMEGQKVLVVAEDADVLLACLKEKKLQVEYVNPVQVPHDRKLLCEEKYDVIIQIGIFQGTDGHIEQIWKAGLALYKKSLKPEGRLVLAVGNRMGLRYFAGCQDPYNEAYFVGPQGYDGSYGMQLLSKSEYEELLRDAGFMDVKTYYPYPDELFPTVIFSEQRLPEQGELAGAGSYAAKARYRIFEEGKVFHSLLKEGVYEQFADTFLFVCGNEKRDEEQVIYTKYSVERSAKYRIRTEIVQQADGNRRVRKCIEDEAARTHIKKMISNCDHLQAMVNGYNIHYCEAYEEDEAVAFEWIKGESLQDIIHRYLQNGKEKEAEDLIKLYVEKVKQIHSEEICNIDLIFSNILIVGDTWNIIDYEWVFEENIPIKWILYRAMLMLANELSGYKITEKEYLMKLISVSEEEENTYLEWELRFQEYIRGGVIPIQQRINALGTPVYHLDGTVTVKELEVNSMINLHGKNAKKILYHVDCFEQREGQYICCGWACAKIGTKDYIPVEIAFFDDAGQTISGNVKRTSREDVSKVLKENKDFHVWGFEAVWNITEGKSYTMRLNAGKCWLEIALEM